MVELTFNKWLKTDFRHQCAALVTKGGASRLAKRFMQKTNMRISILLLLILFPPTLFAGDYQLYVTTDTTTICNGIELKPYVEACEGATWRPLCQAQTVAEDLQSYFSGKEPSVKFLVSAFGNGHVTFCTEEARIIVSETLQKIKAKGNNERGRHLDDFISTTVPTNINKQ
jgi:hypothetical protein